MQPAPYSCNLQHMGMFYKEYLRLMQHWRKIITLPMLELRYEDLVREPEIRIRALVEFCGLPWEDSCLEFYKNTRQVITASRNQVNQPIYTSSVERWRNYEPYIQPLLHILNDVL